MIRQRAEPAMVPIQERQQNRITRLSCRAVVRTFADAVNRVVYTNERIVVTRRGKAIAVLSAITEEDRAAMFKVPPKRAYSYRG